MEVRTYNSGKESQNVVCMITADDCCWYSYTHNKYYCRYSHEYNGIDLLHRFETQQEFLAHLKKAHNIEKEPITLLKQCIIPHKSNICVIESPD